MFERTARLRSKVIGAAAGLLLVSSLPAEVDFGPGELITDEFSFAVNIRVVDIDEDGDNDLVVAYPGSGQALWLENTGDASSFTPHPLGGSPGARWGVETADINGDGHIDILTTGVLQADSVYWHESDGGSPPQFAEHTILARTGGDSNGPRAVCAADFDGDGDLDVASTSDAHDFIGWHENLTGDGASWETHEFAPLGGAWGLSCVDLDGDGDPDLLAASRDSDSIFWYENFEGEFTKRTIATGRNSARYAFAGDFDGDGDLDVVSAASSGGFAWHRNDGGVPLAFTTFSITSPPGDFGSARPVDLDGDGDLDFVASASLDHALWFENDGEEMPTFTSRSLPPTAPGSVVWAEPGDLDGDGDPDIVTASLVGGVPGGWLRWHENGPLRLALTGVFEDHSGDGVNMPGEPGSLRVTVTNEGGSDVSGVVVSIESLTEGLEFEFTTATIATFAPTDSITIDFPYGVDESIECGALLQASLRASLTNAVAEGAADPEPVGGVIEHTVLTSSLPRATIPDGDSTGRTVCININAPDSEITVETLQVAIEHPHRGDLLIELTAPSGQTVTVFDGDPSDAGVNLLATYPLSDLVGGPADGSHCLRIVDRVEGNRGQLSALTLEVGHRGTICEPWDPSTVLQVLLGEEAPAPWLDYTADGAVDAADLVTGTNALAP